MSAESRDVTQLLIDWNHGDAAALDALMPRIVDELRKVAGKYLRGESAASTLQQTALINEVYLRLVDRQRVSWQDRAHFFSFAALTMRRVPGRACAGAQGGQARQRRKGRHPDRRPVVRLVVERDRRAGSRPRPRQAHHPRPEAGEGSGAAFTLPA